MEDLRKLTDSALLALLKSGNSQAMTGIYERYWGVLLHHAHRLLPDEDECKDVIQDVFVGLWQHAPTLGEDSQLAGYLHRSVRNRVLNKLARDQVRLAYLADVDEADYSGEYLSERIHELELLRLVEAEISRMPDKMRTVYLLRRETGLSQKEISSQLAITVPTVRFHLKSALDRLKAMLRQENKKLISLIILKLAFFL